MKFLHLSDLHIGKIVNGFPMIGEQRHVFRQMIQLIETEKPEAVLITGDIYDRAVPGVDAVHLLDDFLTGLAGSGVHVLLISGNHDSPERLSYANRLLSKQKLHLCGVFDGSPAQVTLQDAYGPVHFWLLPFIKPSAVRGIYRDREIESYTDAVAAALESIRIDAAQRNVLLSHQFYVSAGCTPVRSESEIHPVGGLDAADASLLSLFDYAALGHLHGAQEVGGFARYAGSPVKYSFSEWKQQKSMTLVTLKEKGDRTIETLPLTPLHDMREIRGPFAALIHEETVSQADREDYVRIILTDEEEIIDSMGKIRSVYPNVMALDYEHSRSGSDWSALQPDVDHMERLSSFELFSEFFLEINGAVMSEEQAGLVQELLT